MFSRREPMQAGNIVLSIAAVVSPVNSLYSHFAKDLVPA